MSAVFSLAKLCLLMLSNFGYWEFFRRRCKINVYFLPAFTIAVQFTAMFLPGLLNFLGETATLLYIGGLLLFLDALRREKLQLLRPYCNWGYLLLLLGLAVLGLKLHGTKVSMFDCFTHWAVVVKNMLSADRFPTFAQSAVGFSTYPLGSSATIYYFCRMTGREEDFYMLAQVYMLLCMLLPMFAYLKKGRVTGTALAGLTAAFLLCYNIRLTELLVDTVLPLTAAATILFVCDQCPRLEEENPRAVYLGLPMLLLTMNIKNTGVFFVAAALLPAVICRKRNHRSLKPVLAVCAVLLAAFFLWSRHCDYVFLNSASSQHAVSMQWFGDRFSEKTADEVLTIMARVARYACRRRELFRILLCMGGLGALTWLLAGSLKKQYGGLVVYSGILYAAYMVGLMGMYIFSMHTETALELECIDRYAKSIDILLIYLFAVFALSLLANLQRPAVREAAGLLLALLAVGVWKDSKAVFQFRRDYSARQEVETLIDEYGVQKGYRYLICDDNVIDYPAYVLRYHMDTSQVLQIHVTEEAQLEVEKDYDYIFILEDDNPIVEDWVRRVYPDQAGEKVIQCFK